MTRIIYPLARGHHSFTSCRATSPISPPAPTGAGVVRGPDLPYQQRPAESISAERVVAARHASGLTQEGFADELGVVPMTVRRWESRKGIPVRGPTALLVALVEARGLDYVAYRGPDTPLARQMTARRVEALRIRSDLSKREMAEILWATDAAVCHWCSGRLVPGGAGVRMPGPTASRLLYLAESRGIRHIILPAREVSESHARPEADR